MTTRTQDWRFQKLEEGEEYQSSAIFDTVAAGNTKKIFVETPSGAPRLIQETVSVDTGGKLKIQRYENASEDTQGDEINSSNLKVGTGSDEPPFNYRRGGDNETGVYSGGTLEEETLIAGSTSAGQNIGGGKATRPAMILSPGNNMLLTFENQSGQTIDFSVKFEYSEGEV